MYVELESLKLSITTKTNDKVYGLKEDVIDNNKNTLSKINNLKRNADKLETMINELLVDIDTIKNSKYGKKIWIEEKDE